MIHHSPITEHLDSMIEIIHQTGAWDDEIDDTRSLRREFLSALSRRQGRAIRTNRCSPKIIYKREEAETFCSLISNDALSLLDDKAQDQVINIGNDPLSAEKAKRLQDGLTALEVISPDYNTLLTLSITDIFVMPSNSARGGSTSAAIGVIWANPKVSYKTTEIIEFLIHELTHHALFIDELNHQHYEYEKILNPSTWCTSAILNTSRPMDKVFHSLMVAAEILQLRKHYLGHPEHPSVHPPTDILKKQAQEAYASISRTLDLYAAKGDSLVSMRLMQLLDRVHLTLQNLN